MSRVISEECSAIALYGIDNTSHAVSRFYKRVLTWFTDLGCSTDKIAVHGPGHSGKTVSFKVPHAKLVRVGFDGVSDLSLFSLVPRGQIPVNDYILCASISTTYSFANVV